MTWPAMVTTTRVLGQAEPLAGSPAVRVLRGRRQLQAVVHDRARAPLPRRRAAELAHQGPGDEQVPLGAGLVEPVDRRPLEGEPVVTDPRDPQRRAASPTIW